MPTDHDIEAEAQRMLSDMEDRVPEFSVLTNDEVLVPRSDLIPLLRELAAAREAKSTTMLAWVIEHQDSPPGQPLYFTGYRHSSLRWSAPGEHAEACRFARKEDAERIAEFAGFYAPNPTHKICDHIWVSRPLPAPPPAATEGRR